MDEPRKRLERFIGEWTMRITFPGAPPFEGGRVVFEWMPGEQFLIERWDVPVPEAPDGLAVIGFNDSRGTFLQHYFDSRGIARVYAMSLEDGVWSLWRETPDFSPLDFAQRYTATFSDDGTMIVGRWEIAHDGAAWEHDFDLTYVRVR
jgi:hypothetical protein